MDQYNTYKEYLKIRDSYSMLKKQISIIKDEKKNIGERIDELNKAKVKEEIYIKEIEKEKSKVIDLIEGEVGIFSYIFLSIVLYFIYGTIIVMIGHDILFELPDKISYAIIFIPPIILSGIIVKRIKNRKKKKNKRYNELIKEHKNSNSVLSNVQDELNKMIPYKESLEIKYEGKNRALKECQEQFLELLSQV
ncbi:hypothetical protein [Clostridium celatum]|uniref:hypothetical protein n=1 Tax=Clostridium celatum TaxID=36834 RepID=UPI00189C00C4|nr:hypothetical protein [Clostridium celatum]